jgi:hypothetical protein
MLDLAGAEASDSSLVFGSRDTSRANGALDVDNGGSHGGATLAGGKAFGSHDCEDKLSKSCQNLRWQLKKSEESLRQVFRLGKTEAAESMALTLQTAGCYGARHSCLDTPYVNGVVG